MLAEASWSDGIWEINTFSFNLKLIFTFTIFYPKLSIFFLIISLFSFGMVTKKKKQVFSYFLKFTLCLPLFQNYAYC